jgi:hypothetical protein
MENEIVLVLGFYNRKNIGDESYKNAFPILFSNVKKITFACTDDINAIPDDVTIVVCGGGDIINDYFMKKAQDLLKNFTGRSYAISVGIPYESAAKYLNLFDHVFVRSKNDYEIAVKEVGSENVTVIPDISALLSMEKPSTQYLTYYSKYIDAMKVKIPVTSIDTPLRIGLCLAQPYMYDNPASSSLFDSIVDALIMVQNHFKGKVEFDLLSFNYDESSSHECDLLCNKELSTRLDKEGILHRIHTICDPIEMIKFISASIDVALCMRYHSVMFSIIANTRFVPLYVSSKVKNLLNDIAYDSCYQIEMPHDDSYRPTFVNTDDLCNKLISACESPVFQNPLKKDDFSSVLKIIFVDKKHARILVRDHLGSFDDVLLSIRRGLCRYLHIDNATYERLLHEKCSLPTNGKDPLEVARFICFIISGRTHHPCVWGLADKLTSSEFELFESIKYIWEECKTQHEKCEKSPTYYPSLENFDRKVLVNLDFIFQNDFSQYHRSGWSYVIGGLMNLDAQHLLKSCDVMLDTYVDRSFHWGYDILKYIGMMPYTKPWYGFVHHTFDTSHSEYNCTNLLSNPDFIESLKVCRGILVLSKYLAEQFRSSLKTLNIDVPVYTLYHPMEFVPNVFSINKFLSNSSRKIVQIGAWLRNPYGIYALPLSIGRGKLELTKVALKGKEMDQYFPPPGFLASLEDVLLKDDWFDVKKTGRDSVCRDQISRDLICRHTASINKYCKGLYDHIISELHSVEILEKLSNEDYDKLLAENIVFLNLIDCSAVNTVLECIVRNTPLIVNRIDAIEEILGPSYPGFYNTLNEAADLCQDIDKIIEIHIYMSKLDKERYKLEHFIDRIQQIISTGEFDPNYTLLKTTKMGILGSLSKKFQRFLPQRIFQ